MYPPLDTAPKVFFYLFSFGFVIQVTDIVLAIDLSTLISVTTQHQPVCLAWEDCVSDDTLSDILKTTSAINC